jgi:hypothetical protein
MTLPAQEETMGTIRLVSRLGALALALALAACGGGARAPASALAPQAAPVATPQEAAELLLDFAQQQFPQFFPGHPQSQSALAFQYRYYPQTGIYLGVAIRSDPAFVLNGVYLKGGPFGEGITYVAPLTTFVMPPGWTNAGGGSGLPASCGGTLAASGPLSGPTSSLAPPAPAAQSWRMVGMALGSGNVSSSDPNRLMPDVVQAADGLWRMYYGQARADGGWDIMVAESADARSFTPTGIALAGTTAPLDPEFLLRGTSVLRLPDGRWRMYYQASPYFPEGPGASGPPPYFQIMSAVSSDGLHFEREGVRISHRYFDPNALLIGAAHGRVLRLADGSYVAYVSGAGLNHILGVYRLVSADGLSFSAPVMVGPGHDPYVVRAADGAYLMYADTTTGAGFNASELRASSDGLEWSAASRATFYTAAGTQVTQGPDVGGVVLPDGTLRLYTNCNRGIAWYERTQ